MEQSRNRLLKTVRRTRTALEFAAVKRVRQLRKEIFAGGSYPMAEDNFTQPQFPELQDNPPAGGPSPGVPQPTIVRANQTGWAWNGWTWLPTYANNPP